MPAPPEQSFLTTRRGKLTLVLLGAIAFLDFVDGSIVGVALPSIRHALHVSVADLQWVPSGYLLTYGGFMLLGGRAADLLGRRRVLVAGIVLIGLSSLVGGFADSSGMLVGARMAQGLGWRWVMFVNPVACALVVGPVFRLIGPERRDPRGQSFDALGAALVTGGMLLLIYALVKAPDVGWGATRTIAELAGALVLLATFVVNELRHRNPLAPLSIFKINGLGFADATQLVAFAGFLSLFFFLTLYMQNVLGYSPIQTGLAYLPMTLAAVVGAGVSSALLARTGTRPLIVVGALITAGGVYWLSRIPVHGSFASDLLPGMLVIAIGIAPVFVAVTTAANAGVPADKAGLAASLLNASQQLGAALGLAILTAVATSRTHHLLVAHTPPPHALTSGFARALLVGSIFIAAAALIGLRATNTRGDAQQPAPGTGAHSQGSNLATTLAKADQI